MKIVCMSDTHNLASGISVPDGDVLIHAGDLTGRGSSREINAELEWLGSLPHQHKIVVPGNHDFGFEGLSEESRFTLEQGYKLHILIDKPLMVEGLMFYGSPWQPWFYDWAFNFRERWQGGDKEAIEKWAQIPDKTDVLITHGPPHGIMDECRRDERVGCPHLLNRVKAVQPKLHVFGHIHEGYGMEATCHGHGNFGKAGYPFCPISDESCGKITTFVNAAICDERYNPVNPPIVVDL